MNKLPSCLLLLVDMNPPATDRGSTKTYTEEYVLPVRPAAGGGAKFESGVVGAVPGCA